ncbi:MAG: 3-methyl-2-oxobutanoate hydroxymethyltransferase [Acidimicrobiia bacterium]
MTPGKLTVRDLIQGRGSVQRTNVFVETAREAAAAEEAGIDIITVDGRILTPAIRRAAANTFCIGGLAFGHLATTDDYLRAACEMYEQGVDAFYCAAGPSTVERLAEDRLPVVGHVGLIPWHMTWTGGWKAVGKTVDTALDVWRQVRRLEDAGAFAAEIEVVPVEIATEIARRSSLFLISMGSGPGCHAQYLFSEDILGINSWRYPRHSKRYVDLAAEEDRLQARRVEAYAAYISEVRSGTFPGLEHVIAADTEVVAAFRDHLERDSTA